VKRYLMHVRKRKQHRRSVLVTGKEHHAGISATMWPCRT
jgi:hypothetical protein